MMPWHHFVHLLRSVPLDAARDGFRLLGRAPITAADMFFFNTWPPATLTGSDGVLIASSGLDLVRERQLKHSFESSESKHLLGALPGDDLVLVWSLGGCRVLNCKTHESSPEIEARFLDARLVTSDRLVTLDREGLSLYQVAGGKWLCDVLFEPDTRPPLPAPERPKRQPIFRVLPESWYRLCVSGKLVVAVGVDRLCV